MNPNTFTISRLSSFAATLLFLSACEIDAPTAALPSDVADAPTALAGLVSADLQASLTSGGAFAGPSFASRADWVTPESARVLALQYAEEFLIYQDTRLERQHGADIDFAALTVDPRVELAETPYVDQGGTHPGPLRRALGSFYLPKLSDSSWRATIGQ